jgi:hypothetical protein
MSKSLVLVVGAGASKEVNLPVGTELREKIAGALDIRYENGFRRSSGDQAIDEAFHVLARELNPHRVDINPYLHSSWRVRDAMPLAISIDNFIDSHRKDERIEICGKLAIASCILAAESQSSLYVDARKPDSKIDFSRADSTWFNRFFQLLHENCEWTEIEERLSRVTIITFNYDRCIEHYLHGALCNYYGQSPGSAAEVMRHLQIFHPYGSVGSLPWQGSEGIGYGANIGGQKLIGAAKGIRTFTEGIDPKTSEIEEIRTTLRKAERVAFLGFAFHPLNLELLFPGLAEVKRAPKCSTFATGLGLSDSDCEVITGDLTRLGGISPGYFQIRNDLACAGLFNEYSRSLRLS